MISFDGKLLGRVGSRCDLSCVAVAVARCGLSESSRQKPNEKAGANSRKFPAPNQHCGPLTAAQIVLVLDPSDLPIFSPSLYLSLVPTSPMMRRMHSIMATPARRARVRH